MRILNQKSRMNQSCIIEVVDQLGAILIWLLLNIDKLTSMILLSSWIKGAWGLIYRTFFSLWYLVFDFIDAAASSLYLLGVSFIVSATITAGSSTSLNEIFTDLMWSLSWFWEYSIKGVYTLVKYLISFLKSSFLKGYLKSARATLTIL
jgi:hypothetical protein